MINMPEEININIQNNLVKEKRDITIYHHSTSSAHIISHSSSITLPLKHVEEEDYMTISIVRGPGNLWRNCLINVPSWLDFELFSEGDVTLTHSGEGQRTLLRIPPLTSRWELKITRANGLLSMMGSLTGDYVTIGEESL
jgi:hypothetical protein